MIDDSIVRGKTIIPLIKLLKEHYNPRSVHVRIPSTPIFAPCFYGINMSTPDELIARKYITDIWDLKQEEIESISQHIGADSLNYLSVEWLIKVVWKIKMTQTKIRWACMACLTWIYPTKWWKKRYKELLV